MVMQPIDLNTARMLLDFRGGDTQLEALARLQLEGAVALQNMLVDPEVGMGYLADEVGMGKTYVTLGVVAMMRYFNPGYRVLYICPSRNDAISETRIPVEYSNSRMARSRRATGSSPSIASSPAVTTRAGTARGSGFGSRLLASPAAGLATNRLCFTASSKKARTADALRAIELRA